MHRISAAYFVLLLASAVYGASFTSGNFLIVYANTATSSVDSTTISPTFIEEFKTDGTSVQSFEISSSCSTDANPYTGAPKLSSDGLHVTIGCRIPQEGVTTNADLKAVVAAIDENGAVDSSTQFTFNVNFYRTQLDGDHVYVAGRNLLGYTPFKSADSLINLTPGVQHVQDVYAHRGTLHITNWSLNTWGLATVGSGLPLTTAPQTVTSVWPVTFMQFPDTITFFDVGDEEYMYISEEEGFEIHKLKKVSGTWTKQYSTSTGFGESANVITSQIFYDNGDGTNTVLFATLKGIYKTIDDGSSFSAHSEIVTRADKVIKGIAWAPSSGTPPVADPPVATPVADPPVATPVADPPVNTPESEPVADTPINIPESEPVADTPINTPESEPVADTPINTPESEPVAVPPVAEPMTDAPIAKEPATSTPIKETPLSTPTSSVPINSKAPSSAGKVNSAAGQRSVILWVGIVGVVTLLAL